MGRQDRVYSSLVGAPQLLFCTSTKYRHPSGLAAKAFAPASCFPSSLRRVNFSQVVKLVRSSD